jgi:hypothetical protein
MDFCLVKICHDRKDVFYSAFDETYIRITIYTHISPILFLDLVKIMNLFSCILIFILFSANFDR